VLSISTYFDLNTLSCLIIELSDVCVECLLIALAMRHRSCRSKRLNNSHLMYSKRLAPSPEQAPLSDPPNVRNCLLKPVPASASASASASPLSACATSSIDPFEARHRLSQFEVKKYLALIWPLGSPDN